MNDQLQQIGQMLSSCVDMAKGYLGPQFAVSIIARHKTGPFHLLLGDDAELTLIGALGELQRIGTGLIRDGQEVEAEPSMADHMVNLLREVTELSLDDMDGLIDLRSRATKVLDMVAPERQPTPQPEDGQLTEVQGDPLAGVGTITDSSLGRLLPEGQKGPFTIGDMADAPAVDGRPE